MFNKLKLILGTVKAAFSKGKNYITDDNTEIEIDDKQIKIKNYVFSPPADANTIIFPEETESVNFDFSPALLILKNGKQFFVTAEKKEALKAFAEKNRITENALTDVWELILEPFVDTEYSAEHQQNTYKCLSEFGFNKHEVDQIRGKVAGIMFPYNFSTGLWDWCSLGYYDLCLAHKAALSERKFIVFYNWSASITKRVINRA
ncbi:MAG: hypothetical protein GY749_25125 [Desulfobacteraceae bacterium]|nr:hypothetical protein [Desulfobacteraceae bacterium]